MAPTVLTSHRVVSATVVKQSGTVIAMDRRACIMDRLRPETRVLEFGPLDRPMVTAADADVSYLDHASNAELAEKYAGNPDVTSANIPHIRYVIPDNDLSSIEQAGDRFDLVVASHVFEHLPNPIGWLRQVSRLLTPEGAVFLVVPDMRFTFDVMRRRTELADWVEGYLEIRDRPAARHIFEHFSVARQAHPEPLWAGSVTPADLPPLPNHSDGFGFEKARVSASREAYIDTHCSTFTPVSLIRLMTGVANLGVLDMHCSGFWPTATGDMEFGLLLTCREPDAPAPIAPTDLEGLARAVGFEGPFNPEALAARERQDHRFRAKLRAAQLAHRLKTRPPETYGFPDLDPVLHDASPHDSAPGARP